MREGRDVGDEAGGWGGGVGNEYRMCGGKECGCVDEVGEWAVLDGVGVMGWS